MFLKDLQRSGHLEVEKISGTMNPADMFTKPLHPQDFATCKTRVPGIFWGSDDGDDQMEVHMIQVQDDQEVSVVSLKVQLFEALIHFLTWLVLSFKALGMPTAWQDHPKHWDTVAVHILGIA